MNESVQGKSKVLRSVRRAQGLSLRAAAAKAGMDPSHLSKLERGLMGCSVTTLYRLAGVLDLRELRRLLGPYVEGEGG